MERNCDALAIMLWRRAYPGVDHETVAEELYEGSLAKHLRNVPHLNESETTFDAEYTYKRAQTVKKFIMEPL